MGRRQTKAKIPPVPARPRGSPGAPTDANIGDERRPDPRLRPFVVAMANAIIKDMLREQRERTQ